MSLVKRSACHLCAVESTYNSPHNPIPNPNTNPKPNPILTLLTLTLFERLAKNFYRDYEVARPQQRHSALNNHIGLTEIAGQDTDGRTRSVGHCATGKCSAITPLILDKNGAGLGVSS